MDITKLFGQMDRFQEKMEKMQDQIHQIQVTQETGAGLVKATVGGDKQLVSISVDEMLLNKKDQIMLQDLIVGAVNLALREVDAKTQEIIHKNALES
ncbi:YbaB/EbfC family nucleoid-associated protein [Cardinium endosymbiont of Culicoides punctatus]|uniref:YbaB/EbfC family nucleoid-associated protein n=1 Tax=Cardinium endosymbiont of Culicoides punctatus TaxID=2304601 RepID=UPI001058B91C|nr:YbaB/EbfC family nucleoid-associated protein [Cardinium endosymbiont of Culicoides punctatus]TDG95496.1 Nucleoid-associated protein YbaB [Cardinium endosymbiont of Culicoides punctatus]